MKTAAISLLLMIVAALPASAAARDTSPGETADVVVDMVGFRNDAGQVGVVIYDERNAAGFPTDPKRSLKQAVVRIHDGRARAVFRGLPPGTYAVAIVHDENSNDDLDLSLVGIPKEGYGASNDAKSLIGPPSFDDARFTLGPGGARLRIRTHYW